MMTVSIAKEQDIAQVYDIYLDHFIENNSYPLLYKNKVMQKIEQPERFAFYVLKDKQEEVLGFADFEFKEQYSILHYIGIKLDVVGKGYGTKLFSEATMQLSEKGVQRIKLSQKTEKSTNYYQRLGFESNDTGMLELQVSNFINNY